MNYNRVQIAGNLTRDPEMRYTPKGTAVCKITVAVNRTWSGDDGQKKEEVTFVDVDAWGKTAETIAQYLKKGSPIFVDGRLKLEQWDDKATGQKRSKLGVTCEQFHFVGSAKKGETQTAKPESTPVNQTESSKEDDSQNIPF